LPLYCIPAQPSFSVPFVIRLLTVQDPESHTSSSAKPICGVDRPLACIHLSTADRAFSIAIYIIIIIIIIWEEKQMLQDQEHILQ
jgi:hypothetical protein